MLMNIPHRNLPETIGISILNLLPGIGRYGVVYLATLRFHRTVLEPHIHSGLGPINRHS